jgi:hypothetical protein
LLKFYLTSLRDLRLSCTCRIWCHGNRIGKRAPHNEWPDIVLLAALLAFTFIGYSRSETIRSWLMPFSRTIISSLGFGNIECNPTPMMLGEPIYISTWISVALSAVSVSCTFITIAYTCITFRNYTSSLNPHFPMQPASAMPDLALDHVASYTFTSSEFPLLTSPILFACYTGQILDHNHGADSNTYLAVGTGSISRRFVARHSYPGRLLRCHHRDDP